MALSPCTALGSEEKSQSEVNILFEGKLTGLVLDDDFMGPPGEDLSPTSSLSPMVKRKRLSSSLSSQRDRSPSPNMLSPERQRHASPCFDVKSGSARQSLSVSPPYGPGTVSDTDIDIKTGSLLLVDYIDGKDCTSTVYVKVIGNTYEHHAQIYTDSEYTSQLGYVSLRNSIIYLADDDAKTIVININPGQPKTKNIKFIADSDTEALEWVKALVPQSELDVFSESSPKTTPMLTRSNRSSPSPSID